MDQNLKVVAGSIGRGLYRIKDRKPILAGAMFGRKHKLTGATVEKISEGRAKELGKSLGIGLVFGGVFGLAHALVKKVAVEITLATGERIYGETSAKGYELLVMHSRG